MSGESAQAILPRTFFGNSVDERIVKAFCEPFFFLPLFLLSSNLISGSTPHDTGKLRLAKYVQVEIRT